MRSIPVVARVDVVVVGGSIHGVSAAAAAADAGASTLLCTAFPYLGEDLCASLRLRRDSTETQGGILAKAIYRGGSLTTPMRVKKVLGQVVHDSNVRLLLSTFAVDVLRDEHDDLAGIVIVNRAGRQAVVAKTIIDATDFAWVARHANAQFKLRKLKNSTSGRVVIGGESTSEARPESSEELFSFAKGTVATYHEYGLRLQSGPITYASLMAREHRARDLTYRKGQWRASAVLFGLPAETITGVHANDAASNGLDRYHPEGIRFLRVLGACADMPEENARRLMSVAVGEGVGRRIGAQAAKEATARAAPSAVGLGVRIGDTPERPHHEDTKNTKTQNGEHALQEGREWEFEEKSLRKNRFSKGFVSARAQREISSLCPLDVREVLGGLRSAGGVTETVPSPETAILVFGEYDVVVVGGGTSGACAAIGAARQGARVLVVEYQHGLGGTGTLGLIGKPYRGRNAGFAQEVPFPSATFTVEDKMEWFRREIRSAGGDIWFGVIGCGAVVEGAHVRGVVVATPEGRGVVLAKCVVDATGNADIAVAAGAAFQYGDDDGGIAMQGAGIPMRPLARYYVNTDYLFVDESDMVDVTRALWGATAGMRDSVFDVAPFIQTRERRRVVGDHLLSYLDQIAGRTYGDSIVYSASDYDSHGYPSHIFFSLLPHDEKSRKQNHPAPGGTGYTPYRCLLPKGIEDVLVTGLGISMSRDASAMVRMQRDLHNQGYAAGVAAASSAAQGMSPRAIDIRALQRHLVEIGSLPADVLTQEESYPVSKECVQDAVSSYGNACNPADAGPSLAIILSHRQMALPLLIAAFKKPQGANRLAYARVLGALGHREGTAVLLAALAAETGWDDKIFQGVMAEYAHLPTPLDGLILSLGFSGAPEALPPLLSWLNRLDAEVTLSHHRAVALALEKIGARAAAKPLAELLVKPGMRGHALTVMVPLADQQKAKRRRTAPLREIILARALLRCGDHENLGRSILEEYRRDVRGLFSRHASAVLAGAGGS